MVGFGVGNPFGVLGAAELEELERAGRILSVKKGDFLFRSGMPVEGIFFLLSGAVRVTQKQGSKESLIRLASRGDWVGHRSIFTSEVYRGSAQAKEGTRVFFASTAVLFRFFEANKNFAHQLIRLIAHDLEAAESRLAERRELSVPTRLISLFRRLDGKFGEPAEGGRLIKTKLSKVELAQMVGASQEVVSRQISKWKKARLLHESGKQFHLSDKLLNRIIRD